MHECNYACAVLDCFQFFGCSCSGWWFGSLLDRSRVVSLLLSLSVVCSGLCGPDSLVTTVWRRRWNAGLVVEDRLLLGFGRVCFPCSSGA